MSKTVVLGVTGSIAAYRAADLCSAFRKEEIDCRVVMSRASREFVGELTFTTLTQRPVITDSNIGDFADRPEHLEARNTGNRGALLSKITLRRREVDRN